MVFSPGVEVIRLATFSTMTFGLLVTNGKQGNPKQMIVFSENLEINPNGVAGGTGTGIVSDLFNSCFFSPVNENHTQAVQIMVITIAA